jgi:hypothetical protein
MKYDNVHLNNPCNLLEKLFDSLVVPIILYGSEVWGVGNKFRDSDPFEHLHLKFSEETPCTDHQNLKFSNRKPPIQIPKFLTFQRGNPQSKMVR